MCGIAGYFGHAPPDPERIQATLGLMQRRGPDHQDHGHWTTSSGRQCHLLHSRLSIIDLDPRSNQPFTFGRRTIVFNGELYNYREIKQELLSEGYTFQTQSDTEVLLAAIDRFGWDVLDRCEGMWAFAVYDEADGTLTLCRDRFGEKPLYLRSDDHGLYFASEPKQVFELRGQSLETNHRHLYRYLVNGYRSLYKELGETFFDGLEELPAATVLRVNASGDKSTYRYWQPKANIDESMSREDAVAGARERLLRSVDLRLRADVPIAFCMSGGVDSNTLISIARNVFGYDVHGFTIVNTDSRYEEQDIVEQSVSDLGIRHTNVPVQTQDFLPRLRELVAYHDSPVCTITYFAHWLLMQSVAEHGYRISVSGTAADEVFTGYFDHHLFYLAALSDQPPLYELSRKAWETHVKPIVRNPHLSDPQRFVVEPDFRDHLFMNSDGFAEFLKIDFCEAFTEQSYTEPLLRNRMLNELFHEITPPILHEDDLNAMYYSIENRSPFLDRELFEFCNRIPTQHLIRDGFNKSVLRDSMRGIVPDCVLDTRRKVGFNVPIFSFLDVNDPDVRAQLLDDSPIFEHIRRDAIEDLVQKSHLPNSASKFLFYFLSCKMFLEENVARVSNLPTKEAA